MQFWPGLPPDDWKKDSPTTNSHSFVFLKSKKNVEGIVIDDGNDEDLVDIKEGAQLIISYSSIANLLKKGEVHLI